MRHTYNKLIGGAFHNQETDSDPTNLMTYDKETGQVLNIGYAQAYIRLGGNIATFYVAGVDMVDFSSLANQVRIVMERQKLPFDKAVDDVLSKIEMK